MPLTLFPWSRGISTFCLFSIDLQSTSHMAPAPWSQPRILHWVPHLPSQFEADLASLSLHWPASTLHHCCLCPCIIHFVVVFVIVQLLCRVWLFVTPWTAACQSSLSFTISWSLLKLMSTESVMPSNHLILCQPPSPPAFNLSHHQGLF